MLTSLVGFDHELVDCLQLAVVELADLVGLNVGHVRGAGVFEVRESFGDEDAEDFEVCCADCIEDLQALWSVDLCSALSFAWNDEEEVRRLKYVLWKGVEEERVDAGPILAHFDSVFSSPMACFCSAGKNHKLYYRCEDRMHADRRTSDDVGSRKVKCRWKCG
jgi:hypothetical protein